MNNLAIDGAPPVRRTPWPRWPHFGEDEIAAATEVLRSGRVNQWTGSQITGFEQDYAALLSIPHAIALMNGTVALELALAVHDIGPGDEVITTSRTFIASASAVVMRGAKPVIADVDRSSQNLSAETIAPLITPRTRAIIAVHLAGWPCEMGPIMALAAAHDIVVIEDCAQSHGALLNGRHVGTFGHAAAFSFCQDKIITTAGEGGMLLIRREDLFRRAWAFKDHGKSYAAVFEREHAPGFRWLHESFGTNWRMTEIQAAIGRLQLAKLPVWGARRRHNADLLDRGLEKVAGIEVARVPSHIIHARYKYYAFLDLARLRPGWTRDRVVNAISAEGVACFSGSCSEIYLEQAFVRAGLGPSVPLHTAHAIGQASLMFEVHPTLSDADIEDVTAAVAKVMAMASA